MLKKRISRRTFLKAVVATGVVIGGGYVGRIVFSVSRDQMELVQELTPKILASRWGESKANTLTYAIVREYEALVPQIPYVGSEKENKFADLLPIAAYCLAMYRVLTPSYATLSETGKVSGGVWNSVLDVR